MIDPDKPMRVNVQNSTVLKLEPAIIGVTGGLLRALQTVAAHADSMAPDQSWRLRAYRDIFEDLFATNHMGTGSAPEKEMHKALELIGHILGVENLP